MIPDYLNYYLCFPYIKQYNQRPPTLYSILESIVNFGKKPKTKIKDLAKEARATIFDFDYPLTENIKREDFECMILNKFMMRRIGFETVTQFSIQLQVKLNSIMPIYNKMFDALENWNIFNDGEKTERKGFDNRVQDTSSNTTNVLSNNSETTSENIQDRRFSDTPQNQLSDVRDGSYVTNYGYDTTNNTTSDTSTSNGTSNNLTNVKDNNNYEETIKKTNANKIEIMKEMQNNIQSIYKLIFNELEDLFYGLI